MKIIGNNGAEYSSDKIYFYRFFNIGEIADKMEGLLRPTNEKGEAHFCRLCAEFLEGRK